MSKAFTSEETEDEAPRGRAPPRAGEARPITPAGKAALESELRTVQEARSSLDGDATLSGIEKTARKDDLQRREELLAATVATVIEVGPPADRSKVSFGCTIELEDERGKTLRYHLVGPDETDARAGRISSASPLGMALLGHSVGDEVELERPRGTELLLLRRIVYA